MAHPEPALVLSSRGLCVAANDEALALLEMEAGDLLDQPPTRWIEPESYLASSQWQMKALTGTSITADVSVLGGRSASVPTDLVATPMPADGHILVVLRPQAGGVDPRMLQAIEEFPDGVGLFDLNLGVRYTNPAFDDLYGTEARGLSLWDFFVLNDPASLRRFREILAQVQSGSTWSGRLQVARGSGEAFPAHVSLAPLADGDGGVRAVSVVVRDLTREIEREKQASRAQRLASIGTLLSNTAHEINNPLASISNFLHTMLADDSRTEADVRRLKLMERETERLARIVADLRSVVSQDEEAKVERGPVDLDDVLRHLVESQSYRLESLNIEVETDLNGERPVWADRPQIEQVLLNLIVNAEQALSDQAGTRRLRIRTTQEGRGLTVFIDDNGPGIPEHLRERIFDPFWTSKTSEEGIGVGLSLVHQIVAAHGGNVQAEASPLGGARFRIEIPLARSEPHTEPAEQSSSSQAEGGLRVLLVDDEEVLRTSIVDVLRLEGHSVDEATDGREALERIEASDDPVPYDVVLSDLRMSGLGGDQLLNRLRETRPELARRVIFLTGDTASSGATRLLSDAAVPVIYKPFKPQDVLEAVSARAREAGSDPTATAA